MLGGKSYFLYNIIFRKPLTPSSTEQASVGQAVVIETAWDLVHSISVQVPLEVRWEAQSEKKQDFGLFFKPRKSKLFRGGTWDKPML